MYQVMWFWWGQKSAFLPIFENISHLSPILLLEPVPGNSTATTSWHWCEHCLYLFFLLRRMRNGDHNKEILKFSEVMYCTNYFVILFLLKSWECREQCLWSLTLVLKILVFRSQGCQVCIRQQKHFETAPKNKLLLLPKYSNTNNII